MTQEEKDLLLRDLSSRLPYNTKVLCRYRGEDDECMSEDVFILNEIDTRLLSNPYWIGGNQLQKNGFPCGISDFAICIDDEDVFIKPYLRSMSNMTEEERKEYLAECDKDDMDAITTPRYHGTEWLITNHFDYRGLIPMGLALEAPEGMYKTK